MPALPGLDHKRAKFATGIFDKLCLPDVIGTPLLKDAVPEWFREIVSALHGSLIDGERQIREPFILVPKKNSKTSYGAGLMLASLLINKRPNAEFLLIAPTQAIAELAFRQVEGMVRATSYAAKTLTVQSHIKRITHNGNGATLQVKSFDPRVLTGVKPSGVLLDELHVISTMADADRVVGQLRGGLISQREAFLIFITTQSERPPTGVFRAELMKARAIRDGRATGHMLPIIYEFPDEIAKDKFAWRDPANWWMVNPNRNRSVTIDRLVEDFKDAEQAGDAEVRRWASQHLNVEIGLALQSDRWTGADYWEAMADPSLTLDSLIERSEVVTVGVDGGGLDDLLGLCVLGRDYTSREWLCWNHAWAHNDVLERRKQDVAPRILDFASKGEVTIIEQYGQDVEEIADIVMKLEESGRLPDKHAIGVDQIGIGQLVNGIAAREFDTARIVGVPQGYRLNGAIETVGRMLAEKRFRHAGQSLMAWSVGNAKVVPKGNAIAIEKQASGRAKIDPLMATFDAAALLAANPESMRSAYEDRGLIVIA